MSFDDLFGARACPRPTTRFQALPGGFVEGLLLPAERNKTLTALANTEPVVGAQRKEAQSLQWFLSESGWNPEQVNRRRVKLMLEDPKSSAPSTDGVLVIDEHGDRKWGKKTAHVGRQWLANIGKTDSGVVSVSSLLADERLYWPVGFEPYTPAHHFEGGKEDPKFRTKLKIAQELVEHAVEEGISFRAVVTDSFYGEDEDLKWALRELSIKVGYVLALKPSHSWLHREGEEIGALWEAALGAQWEDPDSPGDWVKVVRRFRDGHKEKWWALEVDVGPYGPEERRERLLPPPIPKSCPTKLRGTWLPTCGPPPLRAGEGGERARGSRLGGSGAPLWLEDVGGAELQAGQACAGLERLPGQKRHCHSPSLAVGVLRFFVLLVGIWALADRGGGRDQQRCSRRRFGGKGEKGKPGYAGHRRSGQ